MTPPTSFRARSALAVVIGLALMVMGVLHFVAVDAFVAVMPPYLPAHRELVWLSGIFELALGAAAIVPRTRAHAGWGIALLLIAVFPANVHMAVEGIGLAGAEPPPSWVLWARLPFQAVFIAAALWSTRALALVRRRTA
ncbi:MAG: DoxX family protein [Myxococcota bacterium]|nr:DoxX family protein [Myxococcota bacterium]